MNKYKTVEEKFDLLVKNFISLMLECREDEFESYIENYNLVKEISDFLKIPESNIVEEVQKKVKSRLEVMEYASGLGEEEPAIGNPLTKEDRERLREIFKENPSDTRVVTVKTLWKERTEEEESDNEYARTYGIYFYQDEPCVLFDCFDHNWELVDPVIQKEILEELFAGRYEITRNFL